MSVHEIFMRRALSCAKKAAALGEVPVGAVVVKDGVVIATGYNRREGGKSALLHGEMIALHRACRKLGSWRLQDCDLYVTLEPCPMCTGALINARIRCVYVGAMDPKGGCMGSVCDLTQLPFNHRPQVVKGILEAECKALLTEFFQGLRKEKPLSPRGEVAFRPFHEGDASLLKQHLFPNDSETKISDRITQWNACPQRGIYEEYFAVTADASLMGFLHLKEQNDGSVNVDLRIFPGFRGKGYGTSALRQAFSLASDKGYRIFTACLRKPNTPTLRLCKRLGFERVDLGFEGMETYRLSYDPKKQTSE